MGTLLKNSRTGQPPSAAKVQQARDLFNQVRVLIGAMPASARKDTYMSKLGAYRDRIRSLLPAAAAAEAPAALAPVAAAAAALAPAAAAASAAAQDLERIADMTRNVVREFVPEAPFTVAKEGYITIPEQPPERVRLEAQVIAQLDEDSLMKLPIETLQEIQIEYKIAAKRLTRQGIVQAILKHFKIEPESER
jgi:hypothetical protein